MFNRFCFGALLLAGIVISITGCSTTTSGGLTTIVISPSGATAVTVTLAPQGIAQGYTQFRAIGYYGHAGHQITKDITSQVAWKSDNPQVAVICTNGSPAPCTAATNGLATATGFITTANSTVAWTGNSNITASAPGFNGTIVSNNAVFTVTACTSCSGAGTDITSVNIIPSTQTVTALGVPVQYEAIGTTTSGASVALTSLSGVQWNSSNPSVAKIDAGTGLATTLGSGTSTITAIYINPDGTAAEGNATLTVQAVTNSAEPLTSLTVSPNAQTALTVGQTSQFLAIATTGTGTSVNLTNQGATVSNQQIKAAVWTSSNSSVVSIDPATGLAKSVGAGAAVISAIATNPDGSVVTGTAQYTVTLTTSAGAEPLTALTVLPATQTSLAVGQQIHFLALGTTGSGGSVNLTGLATTINGITVGPAVWSSSNPSVASVDAGTGVATSVSAGTTAITAIARNTNDGTVVAGSAVLTVTVPTSTEPFVSLAIVPASQTLYAVSQTASYLAIGTTGTGATVDLTNSATWASSNVGVATAGTTKGQFTAVANGATAITATVKNVDVGGATGDTTSVTASASLTVAITATEPLVSVAIVPSSPTVASPTQSSQLLAIGTFSAAPITQDVTSGLTNPAITTTWSSSNSSVATVTTACPTGLTGLSCTISACPGTSSGGVCTSCAAPDVAVPAGPSCATVHSATPIGLVTGVSQGTAAIVVAAMNPDKTLVTTTTPFTVTGGSTEKYVSLEIIPGSITATSPAQTNQFIALAKDSTGLEFDVTGLVVWKSQTPTVASICTVGSAAPCTPALDGQVTAVTAGTTNITATWTNTDQSKLVAQANYTVVIGATPEPLISINVVPGDAQVSNKGMTQQYLAFGTYTTTPTVRDITNSVTWITLAPDLVSINSGGTPGEQAGLATAQGQEGLGVIYAKATNPDDGTITLSNPVTFTCEVPGVSPPYCSQDVSPSLLATLTVFNAGNNDTNWLITAPSDRGVPNLIHCGPGSALAGLGNSVCTGTYAAGIPITITASLAGGALDNTFGGWTANCDTVVDVPNLTDTCSLPTPTTPLGSGYTTAVGVPTSTNGEGSGAVVSITAAAGSLTACTITTPGTGYVVGDLVFPTENGASGSSCKVTRVNSTTGGILILATTMQTGGDPSGLVGNQSVGALFY
jgi:hypothetical protein